MLPKCVVGYMCRTSTRCNGGGSNRMGKDTPQDPGPGQSRTVALGGPVHYIDFGGPEDGPTVVLVHGLGGSHLNWDLLAPLLRPHARVLALDRPGVGLTTPGDRRPRGQENGRRLRGFL